MPNAPRPQLTLNLVLYAALDALGVVFFACGILWLTQNKAMFFSGFPTDTSEALVATIGGLLLTTWAASRIIRELIKPPCATSEKARKL